MVPEVAYLSWSYFFGLVVLGGGVVAPLVYIALHSSRSFRTNWRKE